METVSRVSLCTALRLVDSEIASGFTGVNLSVLRLQEAWGCVLQIIK